MKISNSLKNLQCAIHLTQKYIMNNKQILIFIFRSDIKFASIINNY